MGQPSTACTDWRWAQATDARNWLAAAHVDLSDPDSLLDTTICIRWLLYNSGEKAESDGYISRYRVDSGAWTPITTTSDYVRAVDHPYRTDGQATSQELGSGTFDEGVWDDNGEIASYDLSNGQESEHELSLQFLSADCPGTTVELQIAFDTPDDLDGYTYNPPSCTFEPALEDIYVTPAAAIANASGQSPAVLLGSHSMTPGNANANASGINPAVVLGSILLTPGVAESLASSIDPTVRLGSHTATPGVAEANASALDPAVFLGSHSLTPGVAEAIASLIDPSVQEGGGIMVTPAVAEALAAAIDPTVRLGSHSMTPAVAEALASAVSPAVILGSHSMTPAQAIALALAMNPKVLGGLPGAVRRWVALNLLTLGVGGRR